MQKYEYTFKLKFDFEIEVEHFTQIIKAHTDISKLHNGRIKTETIKVENRIIYFAVVFDNFDDFTKFKNTILFLNCAFNEIMQIKDNDAVLNIMDVFCKFRGSFEMN